MKLLERLKMVLILETIFVVVFVIQSAYYLYLEFVMFLNVEYSLIVMVRLSIIQLVFFIFLLIITSLVYNNKKKNRLIDK